MADVEVSPSCRNPMGLVPMFWVPVRAPTGEPSSHTDICPDVPLTDPKSSRVCQTPRDTDTGLVVVSRATSLRSASLPVELTNNAAMALLVAVRRRSRYADFDEPWLTMSN